MPITFTEEDFREPLVFTEEDFAEEAAPAKPAVPGLPGFTATEEKISKREPYFTGLKRALTKQPAYVEKSLAQGKIPAIEHPFRTAFDIVTAIPRKFVSVPLNVIGAGFGLATGVAASAGLALQRGKPEEILPDIAKTIKGERQAELGDIFRAVGAPEPAAATAGLLATIGLSTPRVALKSAKQLTRHPFKSAGKAGEEVSAIGKGIAKPFQLAGRKIGQTFKTLKGSNRPQIQAKIDMLESEIRTAKNVKAGTVLDIAEKQLVESKVLGDQLTEVQATFTDNAKTLSSKFNEARSKGIVEVRKLLRESNSALSKNYRQGLDIAEDALVKRGQQMTKGELDGILTKVLIKAQEGALPGSRNVRAIQNLASKFGIEHTIDDFGNAVTGNADEVIKLKDLVAEVKTLNKGLSGKFKQGIGATPDDIILDFFNDGYGEWIAKKSPEFARMQAEYAPIAAIKHEANKVFKPYDFQEIKTTQASNLLKRFGLAKEGDKTAEKNLLKAIEKGYTFQGKQIGGQKGIFTDVEVLGGQLRDLGEQKTALVNSIKQRLGEMKFSNANQRISATRELLTKVDKLTQQRATEITRLQNRTDADRIANILIKAALGTTVLGGLFKAFRK